jgi:hypothetical protein
MAFAAARNARSLPRVKSLADWPAVVHASSRLQRFCFCVVALSAGFVARVQAEPNVTSGAVPVALGTRDPSTRAVTFPVITSAAKPVQPLAAAGQTQVSDEPHTNIQIKGLSGTLNKGDVHQTMETRQGQFDACIEESRRSLRWVSGSIRFAFKVDGEGRIAEVHPTTSTIGHRQLERCLTTAVAATQFPKPAGRATAEFAWGMSVEPAGTKPTEEASPKLLKTLVRKQAREVFESCEIHRRRARFRITAYFAASGHLLSAGAVPVPAHAEDKVDCVLEQFAKWHVPKLKHASKISFDLR